MITRSSHIQSILERIPPSPGVYQYLNKDGQIIYVGKAKNLKRRVSSYFHKEQDRYKTKKLVAQIADIQYVVVESEQDAFLLENNLIKQYQPHYNILLKDGKSYPSICITKEPYPRIIKTRQIIKSKGEYFGPYSYGYTLDLVLELIHKLFPIRTCTSPILPDGIEKNKYKVCLKYHLHNCCGICEQKVTNRQYQDYIDAARQIIRGDAHIISKQLSDQMKQCANRLEYEKAGELKQQIELIEQFRSKTVITHTTSGDIDVFGYDEMGTNVYVSILHIHSGSIVQGHTIEYHRSMDETKEEMLAYGMMELRAQIGSQTKEVIVPFIPDEYDVNLHIHIAIAGDKKKLLDLAMQNVKQYKQDRLKQEDKLNPDQRSMRILTQLQSLLQLPRLPLMIDSFDNSNLQGSNPVASCVVFRKAKPSKSDYKLFTIQTVEGQDDYASMREVAFRRYRRLLDEHSELPDLIIADGGIAQMHAIQEAVEGQLGLSIPIAGLKKDNHHRTNTLLFGFPPREFGLKVTDEVFHLMVQIQDEVHRVAIGFHKKRRSKSQISSELDDIQGVGEKTKQKILTHFGSITRAGSANLDEWNELLGNHLGSILYHHFNPKISR